MSNVGIINELSPFGRGLKNRLMEINKTQRWLAQQLKVDPSVISEMVRGTKCHPDREKLVSDFLDKYQTELNSRTGT